MESWQAKFQPAHLADHASDNEAEWQTCKQPDKTASYEAEKLRNNATDRPRSRHPNQQAKLFASQKTSWVAVRNVSQMADLATNQQAGQPAIMLASKHAGQQASVKASRYFQLRESGGTATLQEYFKRFVVGNEKLDEGRGKKAN